MAGAGRAPAAEHPRRSCCRHQQVLQNRLWRTDGIGYLLAGGQHVCALQVLDDRSRIALVSRFDLSCRIALVSQFDLGSRIALASRFALDEVGQELLRCAVDTRGGLPRLLADNAPGLNPQGRGFRQLCPDTWQAISSAGFGISGRSWASSELLTCRRRALRRTIHIMCNRRPGMEVPCRQGHQYTSGPRSPLWGPGWTRTVSRRG